MMNACYKCGVEEDYTDQFAVTQGAVCWNCYCEYHMTGEEKLNANYCDQIRRIGLVLELGIKFETKIGLVRAIIQNEEIGSWEKLSKIRQEIWQEHQQAKQAILKKLTDEECRILGV